MGSFYKCRNFLDIAKKADEYYQNQHKHKGDTVGSEFDFDWFLRFFDAAGNISNEKMKDYYAKVLSGEIERPGTFSLRALDTLYNMSRSEMQVFSDLSNIVLDGAMFFSSLGDIGQEINEKYGFNNDTLRLLEECGILNGLKMQNALELLPTEAGGYENKGNLLLLQSTAEKSIELIYVAYCLTKVGIELLPIVYQDSSSDYLCELGSAIKKKYTDLKVSVHPYKEADSDSISFDPEIDILKEFEASRDKHEEE